MALVKFQSNYMIYYIRKNTIIKKLIFFENLKIISLITESIIHQLEPGPGSHFVAVHTARLSTDGAEIWTNLAKNIAKKVMLSPMPLSLMTSLDCIFYASAAYHIHF